MELLAQLKNEDDNPRGQQQGRFVSGATLEEAAAAETRRAEIKAAKLPLPRQEAGIIHLMQARNFFARLKLPEPTWDADGAPVAAWIGRVPLCRSSCHSIAAAESSQSTPLAAR